MTAMAMTKRIKWQKCTRRQTYTNTISQIIINLNIKVEMLASTEYLFGDKNPEEDETSGM